MENTHEAIISKDDFKRVQEFRETKNYPARHNKENIFKGILFCSNCGRRMVLAVKPRKSGFEYIFYKCSHHYQRPDLCNHHNNIEYNTLKEIITLRIREFFKHFNNQETIDRFLELKSHQTDEDELIRKEIIKCDDRLNNILKITRKLYEDSISQKIDEDTYNRLLSDYQKEQKDIQNKLTVLKSKIENKKDYKQDIIKLREVINEVINFKELTLEIVLKLISRINIDYVKETDGIKTRAIKITYRFIEKEF